MHTKTMNQQHPKQLTPFFVQLYRLYSFVPSLLFQHQIPASAVAWRQNTEQDAFQGHCVFDMHRGVSALRIR